MIINQLGNKSKRRLHNKLLKVAKLIKHAHLEVFNSFRGAVRYFSVFGRKGTTQSNCTSLMIVNTNACHALIAIHLEIMDVHLVHIWDVSGIFHVYRLITHRWLCFCGETEMHARINFNLNFCSRAAFVSIGCCWWYTHIHTLVDCHWNDCKMVASS